MAARVGIEVRLNVEALLASRVDEADDLVHPAPAALVGDLDVQDLDRDAGAARDLDHLLDGVEDAGPLVAHVDVEDALVPGDDLAQLDEIVGRGEDVGRLGQARRQPAGPLFHRLGDELLHLFELGGRGPGVAGPHDAFPDVPQADERRDVDGDAGLLGAVEVLAERVPADGLLADANTFGRQLAEKRAG